MARDGVFGAIQIHGPASAPYDIDVGPVLLGDWMHDTVEHVFETQGSGIMELGLINGSSNFNTTFQEGKSHLVRLINTSMDTVYKVSLDGHKMKVIGADYTPIVPYETDTLWIQSGQRYMVVVEMNQVSPPFATEQNMQILTSSSLRVPTTSVL